MELLVVVSIIALLIAILLPGLNKARGAAKTVFCLSQIRQLGLMAQYYANDNNNVIVAGHYGNSGGSIQVSYDDSLASYYGLTLTQSQIDSSSQSKSIKSLVCPSDTLPPGWGVRRTYSLCRNSWGGVIYGAATNINTDNPMPSPTTPNANRWFKTSEIKIPAQTMLATERGSTFNNLGNGSCSTIDNVEQQLVVGGVNPTNNTPDLHAGLNNYLLLDSHAQTLLPINTVGTGDTLFPKGIWTRDGDD